MEHVNQPDQKVKTYKEYFREGIRAYIKEIWKSPAYLTSNCRDATANFLVSRAQVKLADMSDRTQRLEVRPHLGQADGIAFMVDATIRGCLVMFITDYHCERAAEGARARATTELGPDISVDLDPKS